MADISTCRLCGRKPAEGWAVADNGAGFPVRLCHGATQRISCYVRWTTYGERPTAVDKLLGCNHKEQWTDTSDAEVVDPVETPTESEQR